LLSFIFQVIYTGINAANNPINHFEQRNQNDNSSPVQIILNTGWRKSKFTRKENIAGATNKIIQNHFLLVKETFL